MKVITTAFAVATAMATTTSHSAVSTGVTPSAPPIFDRETACQAAKSEAIKLAKSVAKADNIKILNDAPCREDRCQQAPIPNGSPATTKRAWICMTGVTWERDESKASTQNVAAACPPIPNITPRPNRAPIDDLLGVRPGTDLNAAISQLKCKLPNLTFEEAGSSCKKISMAGNRNCITYGPKYNDISGMDFGNRKIRTSYTLHSEDLTFTIRSIGEEGTEKLYGIWERQYFRKDQPSIDQTKSELISKYGQPSAIMDKGDALIIEWQYTKNGKLIQKSDPNYSNCSGDGTTWREGCGLTIFSSLRKSNINKLLADWIDIGVFEQGQYYSDGMAFEKKWKGDDDKTKHEAASKAKPGTVKF